MSKSIAEQAAVVTVKVLAIPKRAAENRGRLSGMDMFKDACDKPVRLGQLVPASLRRQLA